MGLTGFLSSAGEGNLGNGIAGIVEWLVSCQKSEHSSGGVGENKLVESRHRRRRSRER